MITNLCIIVLKVISAWAAEVERYFLISSIFENKQVYYAHLAVESESAIYLYISENTERKEIINFFTMAFKDFPGLQIVSDDVIID